MKRKIALASTVAMIAGCASWVGCSRTAIEPGCTQVEKVLAAMPRIPESGFDTKQEYSDYESKLYKSIEESGVEVGSRLFVNDLYACLAADAGARVIDSYGEDRVAALLQYGVSVARDLGDSVAGANLISVQIKSGEDPKYLAFSIAYGCLREDNCESWFLKVMQDLVSKDAAEADMFVRSVLAGRDDTESTLELLDRASNFEVEFDRDFVKHIAQGYYEEIGDRPLLRVRM